MKSKESQVITNEIEESKNFEVIKGWNIKNERESILMVIWKLLKQKKMNKVGLDAFKGKWPKICVSLPF